MRTTTSLALASSLLVLAVAAAGCADKATTYVCDPLCPTGFTCGANGCVATTAAPDLSGQAPGDMTQSCDPACSGATPFCNSSFQCVACLADADCGAGRVCLVSGATTLCLPGCRDDSGCNNGGANPERKCCSGGCIDTSTDAANCGQCGGACAIAHASAACSASTCQLDRCASGWGNCDGDPGNGCEANLTTDPAQCGRCGNVCQITNALAACSTSCYIAACNFGWDDCDGDAGNGCEQRVVDDAKNCGSCGNSCAQAPHAAVGCFNANCELTSCVKGFLDCNGNALDGCEVTGATDPANCGACANACAKGMVCRGSQCTCPQCNIPNASSRCFNNQCTLDKCNPGYGDCDGDIKNGCEVDLSKDANNCNACKNVCPKNLPYCIQSVCSDTNHNIYVLMPDYNTQGVPNGCGDYSTWWTQDMGQMNYDDCETLANQYGAQYMGETGYFSTYDQQAPYARKTRWVGEADKNNGWISTQNWSVSNTAPKGQMYDCVLAYANANPAGMATFDTAWVSDNGKTYQVNDYGVTSEKTCYSNANAAGARPLNPWLFHDAVKSTAHMVENHICHGSQEYSGLNSLNADGNRDHSYRCLVGYTNN